MKTKSPVLPVREFRARLKDGVVVGFGLFARIPCDTDRLKAVHAKAHAESLATASDPENPTGPEKTAAATLAGETATAERLAIVRADLEQWTPPALTGYDVAIGSFGTNDNAGLMVYEASFTTKE